MALRAPISRPNLVWRSFVLGGVGTMAALSVSDTAWAWWEEHVTGTVPRSAIRGTLVGTAAIHAAEAAGVRRLARRTGLPHKGAHVRSTLIYGVPAWGRARRAARAAA